MSTTLGIIASSRSQAAPLLLDVFPGASAAYSFRKLNSAYTGNCIRLGRSNDTIEINIGFNSLGYIDTTAILTFVGLNNGYIKIWYDQSGNGNDTFNPTGALIVSSGVLITDNSLVAATNLPNFVLNNAIVPNTSYTCFALMSRTTSIGYMTSFSGNSLPIITIAYNNGILYNYNLVTEIQYSFTNTGRFLFTTLNQTNVQSAYLNNVLQTVTTNLVSGTGNIVKIFGRNAPETFEPTGKTQEQIFYNTNQASNVTGIQNNINSYYTIY